MSTKLQHTSIRASAGTGKTYAIASLYLRLLVEQELLPEQILVVTYTEAATQELRSRIRTRIREALEVMEGGDTQDAFLEELRERTDRLPAKVAADNIDPERQR